MTAMRLAARRTLQREEVVALRAKRLLLLSLLIAAEAVVLVSIVWVLRTPVGAEGWAWTEGLFRIGGWGGTVWVSEERVIPMAAAAVVQITNDHGRVTVREATADFGVRALVHASGRNREEARQRLALAQVTVEGDAQQATVTAQAPPDWPVNPPYANLEIRVPRGSTVDVKARMGAIELSGLHGQARLEAGMGRVEVGDFHGSLDVVADMGRVKLERVTIADTLHVAAKMGSVEFTGRLGRDNKIEAKMGNVVLKLAPGHPALQLDAVWKMGRLDLDLPCRGEVKEREASCILGSGPASGQLFVQADMGRIEIK
jgi:hypothetical protein